MSHDLAAIAGRLHTEYMQALRGMNVDLRAQLFAEFERVMSISERRALRFFSTRRALRAFFDAELASASGETLITIEIRHEFGLRLLRIRATFINTASDTAGDREDIDNIRRIFDDVMRIFLAETARMVEEHGAEDGDVELRKCIVCTDRNVEVVCLPCRHACMCQVCHARILPTGGNEDDLDPDTFEPYIVIVPATRKCALCRTELVGSEPLTTVQLRSLCLGNIVNDSSGQPIRFVG